MLNVKLIHNGLVGKPAVSPLLLNHVIYIANIFPAIGSNITSNMGYHDRILCHHTNY